MSGYLTLDIVHKMLMVTLYPLSGGSVLATPEAAEDAQGAGLFLVYMQHKKLHHVTVK